MKNNVSKGVLLYYTPTGIEFFLMKRNCEPLLFEFIGGKKQDGEHIKSALIRESREEIGEKALGFIYFEPIFFDIKKKKNHNLFFYFGHINDKDGFLNSVELSKEHSAARFFNLAELSFQEADLLPWVPEIIENAILEIGEGYFYKQARAS
jgi:8-oxo-dGTP pyrophosphatase MutT (NUDIX family)